MSATITYETADGVETVQRDEYHTDQEPLLVAYNNDPNERGVTEKVIVPVRRVIKITESD